MRLVLVRHGETAWNKEGRFQGQTPVGLNEVGLAQAGQVAKALVAMKPRALYASPLPRCLMTAEAISREVDIPVVPLDGIKELNLGELEGITRQEMLDRYADVAAAWSEDPSEVLFPGGEAMRQLQERAWAAFMDMANAHLEDLVVAVSHNFTIRATLCRFLGLPLSQFQMFRVDLGSISILQASPNFKQILVINDRCHLSMDALLGT